MRLLKDIAVPAYLKMYHKDAYPDDGNWEDWHYSFAPIQSSDQYVLLIKYRRPPREGDLYSKVTYDGLYLASIGEGRMLEFLRDDFDMMRVEIIETLDGLQVKKPKPIVKHAPPIRYIQEYPTKDDPFNWKAHYQFQEAPF